MWSSLLLIVLAQGVSADSILIGMEGPANSFSVDEENLGLHLVIRHINAAGGVHGRRLDWQGYPRGSSDPVGQAVINAKRLVEEDGVFLLFNFGGPAAVQVGEYAMANDVPYMFPHTALLTVDGNRHVFTSFPRYEGESAVMLDYLVNDRRFSRIGIIHAPNIYGEYFESRVSTLADGLGYEYVGGQALPLRPESAESRMSALRKGDPDVVVMALYPAGARAVVEAKAALGWDVKLVSSGPLTDEQYLNVDGGHAEGTLGFCHYPDPTESSAAGVKSYRELMATYYPGHPLNRYSLYGYVFGSLVVEGLSRAGPDLTRDSFIDAMESIEDWNPGDILPPVSFSKTNHHAQKAGYICELIDGRFKPLTGWIEP